MLRSVGRIFFANHSFLISKVLILVINQRIGPNLLETQLNFLSLCGQSSGYNDECNKRTPRFSRLCGDFNSRISDLNQLPAELSEGFPCFSCRDSLVKN